MSEKPTFGLSYPFPLRPDVTLTICDVPRDLTMDEVELVTRFLKTLVAEPKPETP